MFTVNTRNTVCDTRDNVLYVGFYDNFKNAIGIARTPLSLMVLRKKLLEMNGRNKVKSDKVRRDEK